METIVFETLNNAFAATRTDFEAINARARRARKIRIAVRTAATATVVAGAVYVVHKITD